jgi:hypothetical protein
MEPVRYDRPVVVMFGRQEITLEPLRGLKALQAFQAACYSEIEAYRVRLEEMDAGPHHPLHLMAESVDSVKLLRLACPALTEELIEESTANERMGVVCECLRLNHLGHLVIFLDPGTLLDIAMRMRKFSEEVIEGSFGPLESVANSSALDSAGATSNSN